MDSATIEQMISAGLPDAQVEVSGEDGVHFEALVISPSFEDVRRSSGTVWSTRPWGR